MYWKLGIAALLMTCCWGCGGVRVKPTADRVPLSGAVTSGGKPVTDIKMSFLPTGEGLPCFVEVKNGKYSTNIVPGRYTYHVDENSKNKKAVPVALLERTLDRQFEISSSGGTQDFQLE